MVPYSNVKDSPAAMGYGSYRAIPKKMALEKVSGAAEKRQSIIAAEQIDQIDRGDWAACELRAIGTGMAAYRRMPLRPLQA